MPDFKLDIIGKLKPMIELNGGFLTALSTKMGLVLSKVGKKTLIMKYVSSSIFPFLINEAVRGNSKKGKEKVLRIFVMPLNIIENLLQVNNRLTLTQCRHYIYDYMVIIIILN